MYQVIDTDETEVIAFHWHPTGVSRVRDPHLHLSSKLRPVPIGRAGDEAPLASMHVPTGFVPLADVVRFLIDEFGIIPLRDDWHTVLSTRRALTDFPSA